MLKTVKKSIEQTKYKNVNKVNEERENRSDFAKQ